VSEISLNVDSKQERIGRPPSISTDDCEGFCTTTSQHSNILWNQYCYNFMSFKSFTICKVIPIQAMEALRVARG
jgi:hypothetical protein